MASATAATAARSPADGRDNVGHSLPPTRVPAGDHTGAARRGGEQARTCETACQCQPKCRGQPDQRGAKIMPDGRQAGPVPSEIYRHTGWVTRRRRCVKLGDHAAIERGRMRA